ncbi:DNA polymerase delta subunit 3 [Nymphaea thermarum]|nr:DNA polymerase delta subunit 3 [Nymphaea thermarum]
MGAIDSASILDEIQSIVHDKLQVVSYKWLSRYFSLSSNEAKRVLKEFVELRGGELEVIYALSGWLKNKPQSYSVVLSRKDKLSGIEEEFKDGSIQVYSVQASIPKDPAALVSAEYVQAEELFGQSLTNENCLWDNRYGAVSNSFVKRSADVKPLNIASVEPKTAVVSNSILKKPTESKTFSPIVPQSSVEISKEPVKLHNGNGVQRTKPIVDSEKASVASAVRKKDQNGKKSSGTGGSLANLWGRASSKPKVRFSATDAAKDSSGPISNSEAQIHAQEEAEVLSSDDDVKDHRRRDSNGSGGRKRRVVFDYSDEEDDEAVISLASPEPPKTHMVLSSKCSNNELTVEKKEMDLDEPNSDGGLSLNESPKGPCGSKSRISSSECLQGISAETSNNDHIDKVSASAAVLPRRKILKTRIDDRGREVTEVVWEGETEEDNKGTTDAAIIAKDIKDENNGVEKSTGNRAPAVVKMPAASTNAAPPHLPVKAGSKKTPKNNVKDVKQGSITAFFKKI